MKGNKKIHLAGCEIHPVFHFCGNYPGDCLGIAVR